MMVDRPLFTKEFQSLADFIPTNGSAYITAQRLSQEVSLLMIFKQERLVFDSAKSHRKTDSILKVM